MGKYASLEKEVFAVFDLAGWKALSIPTFPLNFITSVVGNKYVRVGILANGQGINMSSVAGIMMIDIFIPAGYGPSVASAIADNLDTYLVGKSLTTDTGITQCGNSSLTHIGQDKANAALHRSIYSIPFNYYVGV